MPSPTPQRPAGWAALGLFILAPLIAEYLHGNMSVTALPWLVVVAPLYGGGALLIREVVRRAQRGWPTVLLLALAYAVIEEGLVTHTLFNPSYFDYPLLDPAPIPLLGMGAWWTVFVLTLHVVWSISASIALAEALVPHRASQPWLSNRGLALTGVVFVLGAAANWLATYELERFLPALAQVAGTAVAVALLLLAAFMVTARRAEPAGSTAPAAWGVAVAAFAVTSVFIVLGWFPGWPTVAVYLALYALSGWLLVRWTRRPGWTKRHVLALAGGVLVTYAWYAFPSQPLVGAGGPVDVVGNVLFTVGLAGLLWRAARATSMKARSTDG